MTGNALAEVGRLERVLLKHPREAFVSAGAIAAQWKDLNFAAAPSLPAAIEEYDAFVEILQASGAQIDFLSRDERTNLDSIYVRDASVVCARGVILCRMGKRLRVGRTGRAEAGVSQDWHSHRWRNHRAWLLEGGDVVWLDDRTIAVGRGYRTNDEGILQLRTLLADSIDELIVVPLPHWRGPADVLHLMSLISPSIATSPSSTRRCCPLRFGSASPVMAAPSSTSRMRSSRRWEPTCSRWGLGTA